MIAPCFCGRRPRAVWLAAEGANAFAHARELDCPAAAADPVPVGRSPELGMTPNRLSAYERATRYRRVDEFRSDIPPKEPSHG